MANEYFGKVMKTGIQIIPDVITDAAIGTPTTLVATNLSDQVKAITRGFLVKKVHINLIVAGMTGGEALIIGINANDAGVSGGFASTGLAALLDPEASEAYLTEQELVKTVWHETTSMILGNTVTAVNHIDKWVSVGGGKGIPCAAGAGPELFAFNPTGDTITTGGIVSGCVTYYGVWLED